MSCMFRKRRLLRERVSIEAADDRDEGGRGQDGRRHRGGRQPCPEFNVEAQTFHTYFILYTAYF